MEFVKHFVTLPVTFFGLLDREMRSAKGQAIRGPQTGRLISSTLRAQFIEELVEHHFRPKTLPIWFFYFCGLFVILILTLAPLVLLPNAVVLVFMGEWSRAAFSLIFALGAAAFDLIVFSVFFRRHTKIYQELAKVEDETVQVRREDVRRESMTNRIIFTLVIGVICILLVLFAFLVPRDAWLQVWSAFK